MSANFGVLDPSFRYVPSYSTDIRERFREEKRRIEFERRERERREADESANDEDADGR